MAQINELPTEVLQEMVRQTGQDLTRVEPDNQDATKQSAPGMNPSGNSLRDTVRRMKKENGRLGEFNALVQQRLTYQKLMKGLQDEAASNDLKQRAMVNRNMLQGLFGRGGQHK